MIVKEGRILCMESFEKYIMIGTSDGAIVVFDGEKKEKMFTFHFNDSVLCMKILSDHRLVVGLADGSMLVFPMQKLIRGGNFFCECHLNHFLN